MRVTSVELHADGSSDAIVLSYRDPGRENPYNVKTITGLDVDEIVPTYYGRFQSTTYYDLAQKKRDLGIQIVLNPRWDLDESYSVLRDALYKLIASSRSAQIQIWFKDGETIVARISGFITKFESAVFERDPGILISVSCPDPRLQAPDQTILLPPGGDPGTEYNDPASLIITDDVSTMPHGFAFVYKFITPLASFKIHDPNHPTYGVPTWSFEVTPPGGFAVNDQLYFSSGVKQKYVLKFRAADSVMVPIADSIVPGSMWPLIFPGENHFVVDGVTPATAMWGFIAHYLTYWGI